MPVDMTTAVFGLRRYETLVVIPVGGQETTRTFHIYPDSTHSLSSHGRNLGLVVGVRRQEPLGKSVILLQVNPAIKRAVASFKVCRRRRAEGGKLRQYASVGCLG